MRRLTSPRHLDALDVVRVLTIALVVAVHTLVGIPQANDVATGAFVIVFHVSREIFLLLTAFVLMHVYGRRPVRWSAFWRRRYLLVIPPYVCWTLVYLLTFGDHLEPVAGLVVTLGRDLLTGAARYHLYFLLVSMQIYLCFPIIRRLIRATRDHHGKLLVAAVVYQLTFTLAAHAGRPAGGVLGAWLGGPDALLPSYVLYVIAGGVAAWHLDALERAVRVHSRAVLAAGGASVVVGVVVYLVQVAAGRSPTDASAVFQPIVVVESVGVAAAFLALGVMWADRGTPARRIVTAASDASFGVYLAHPLVIQVLLTLGVSTGLDAALGGAPEALALAVALLVISPAVYVSAALVTAAARRTPLSLALTGRPWNRTGAHDIVVRTTAPAASRAA